MAYSFFQMIFSQKHKWVCQILKHSCFASLLFNFKQKEGSGSKRQIKSAELAFFPKHQI